MQADPEKKYGIKRFKALGATVFEGTTDPTDAEAWLNQIKKKLELATFLLQKGVEN